MKCSLFLYVRFVTTEKKTNGLRDLERRKEALQKCSIAGVRTRTVPYTFIVMKSKRSFREKGHFVPGGGKENRKKGRFHGIPLQKRKKELWHNDSYYL